MERICLINPPTTDPVERSFYFPMALLAIGGALREVGVPCELWDFDFYFKSVGNCSERQFRRLIRRGVRASGANVFGISSICTSYPMALWIAREIKQFRPGAVIVFGGPQPTAVPDETLERFPFVDLVVVGEGERTVQELAERGFEPRRCREVPGTVSRVDGRPRSAPARELVDDMDVLPEPDYDLIDLPRYVQYDPEAFVCQIEAGRGCPFRCTFCSTSLMWSRKFRVKSPARILSEMERLHARYGIRRFDFIHDNFTTSKPFVREFCDYMVEHDATGFGWFCASRTDCLDLDSLERMHRAGLESVFFGVESGSQRVQRSMKKNLRLSGFDAVLERMDELGVGAVTAFILGFPEETAEDMDETIERALHYRRLGARRVFFAKLSALAGTEIHRRHVDELVPPEPSEETRAGSVSPQPYGLPWVKEAIAKHPDLCSSFYHIPHPDLSAAEIWRRIEFAQLMVNGCPELATHVLAETGHTPSTLLPLWDAWACENDFGYGGYDSRSGIFDHFRAAFARFARDLQRAAPASEALARFRA